MNKIHRFPIYNKAAAQRNSKRPVRLASGERREVDRGTEKRTGGGGSWPSKNNCELIHVMNLNKLKWDLLDKWRGKTEINYFFRFYRGQPFQCLCSP